MEGRVRTAARGDRKGAKLVEREARLTTLAVHKRSRAKTRRTIEAELDREPATSQHVARAPTGDPLARELGLAQVESRSERGPSRRALGRRQGSARRTAGWCAVVREKRGALGERTLLCDVDDDVMLPGCVRAEELDCRVRWCAGFEAGAQLAVEVATCLIRRARLALRRDEAVEGGGRIVGRRQCPVGASEAPDRRRVKRQAHDVGITEVDAEDEARGRVRGGAGDER